MSNRYAAFLRPEFSQEQLRVEIAAASAERLDGVLVSPVNVGIAADAVRRTRACSIAAISYPFGMSKPVIKAIEATSCLKDGADGAWIVPRWPAEVNAADAMRDELLEIARAIRATKREANFGVIVRTEWFKHGLSLSDFCRAAREGAADTLVVVGSPAPLPLTPIEGISIVSDVRQLSFPTREIR